MDASAVGQLLAANVGKSVSSSQILAAFKADFGDAAPGAVVITCKKVGGVSELSEIDVYLGGNVTGADPLAKLLHVAPGHPSNCASGMLVKPPA